MTKERLQAGFTELEGVSPQAVNYPRQINLALWATPRPPVKRYGHNTSNIVEILNNWIVEERKLSVVDLLHALWSKVMDLRFRHLQEAERYLDGSAITNYAAKKLEVSMDFSNHRLIRYADPLNASVLSMPGKWYVVDLDARTCTCGHFQYDDIPCRHAVAVIQNYRSPDGAQARRSARDFVTYNLTLAAFRTTYDGPVMPPIGIATLALHENEPCHAPLFKKARGRPQTARLAAGEQRARLAAYNGALENIPDHVQRCSHCREEGHNVTRCPALPAGCSPRDWCRQVE